MHRLAVIGAGPAGLIAAISAAQKGAQVFLLEAEQRVGSKILSTGNGRCNLTNMYASPQDYNAPAFVAPILEAYSPKHIRTIFEQLGLITTVEDEGRVYPQSNAANSVLDVLRYSCERYGVNTQTNFEVDVIAQSDEGFIVGSKCGKRVLADKVIIATGGGTRLLGTCGHTIMPFSPVLCALKTQTGNLRGLSGIRAKARVSLYDNAQSVKPIIAENGEVLFRDYGLSGIVIFNMSRYAQEGNIISIDFVPELDKIPLTQKLQKRIDILAHYNKKSALEAEPPSNAELLCGIFQPRIAVALLREAHLKAADSATKQSCEALAKACKDFCVKVEGPANVKNAQVTRGGALVDEFDPLTLESRKTPGIYAAGETLNVDAKCGGYNLHWAWASGLAAGRAASKG